MREVESPRSNVQSPLATDYGLLTLDFGPWTLDFRLQPSEDLARIPGAPDSGVPADHRDGVHVCAAAGQCTQGDSAVSGEPADDVRRGGPGGGVIGAVRLGVC